MILKIILGGIGLGMRWCPVFSQGLCREKEDIPIIML